VVGAAEPDQAGQAFVFSARERTGDLARALAEGYLETAAREAPGRGGGHDRGGSVLLPQQQSTPITTMMRAGPGCALGRSADRCPAAAAPPARGRRAHLVTVLGSTRSIAATSAGVSRRLSGLI